MSLCHRKDESCNGSGSRLCDLLQMEGTSDWGGIPEKMVTFSEGPKERLKSLLSMAGNDLCADCGSPGPKWVSLRTGAFICIKCSGVHRSLGVHITMVLSVTLDEWSDEQVDALIEMGGNNATNMKYEATVPDNYAKPKPESSAEDRTDFIRRKYELQQFMKRDFELSYLHPSSPTSSSSRCGSSAHDKKQCERNSSGSRNHGLFRHSWKRFENKATKRNHCKAGMVEFVGLITVNILRGMNLAVRDMVTSDPYVVLSLGNQTMKTKVIKNNLNPVWNEKLMLSIPENIPPLKLFVYDKDKFSADDFMGSAEINIHPLLSAAKASEDFVVNESWAHTESKYDTRKSIVSLEDSRVKQEITVKLQNVECGEVDVELEFMPLTQ